MDQKNNKNSGERFQYWTDQVNAWKSSTLSQSEYCRQNNLDISLFSKWKIRLNDGDNKGLNGFVRIKKRKYNDMNLRDDIEIVIKDIYKIKIKPDFNKQSLKNLLSILEDQK